MADINVMIAFDAATIVEQNPNASRNPDAPTYVDQSLIYMTTRHDHIVDMSSGAELNLRAEPGDAIKWRETTLSFNTEYKALLYRYVSSSDHKLLRAPEIEVIDGVFPMPREGTEGSPEFVTQNYQDHYWRAAVRSVGKVTYHFYFQILDRHRQLKGYFQWDPFITIENP
ncbi:inclusion body family protein [Streptomyces sp. NPDC002888]|uniref:inclusion body family protein n=1 Tax=Streptomyces sp. NPDC002888 TaxID=3364668 RepID=UPI0036B1CFF3